jgi:hypothetical protein
METLQILEMLKAIREDRKAALEQMKARTETNRERDQVDLKGMMAKMSAKMDAHHKKMMAMLDAHHERTMASPGKTEAMEFKAIPEETESVTEHQEIC